MQKKDGAAPANIVSSELAAMFAVAVLVDIRKSYYDPESGDPMLSEAEFKQRCKDFAAALGLEEWQWPMITLPCFLSLDNDARHTWLRQVLSVPRHSHLEDLDRRLLSEELGIDLVCMPAHVHVPPDSTTYHIGTFADDADVPQAMRDIIQQLHDQAEYNRMQTELYHQLEQKRREYREVHGVDALAYAKWRFALQHPVLGICMTPWQLMPLAKVTPDIHAPPEHAVGTVKRSCTADFKDPKLDRLLLQSGRFIQERMLAAVSSKLNGPAGIRHICGSVRKQPYTCEILSASKDTVVEVPFRCADGELKVKKVNGTAGGWISDRKMT